MALFTVPIFFVLSSFGLLYIQNEQMIDARDALSTRIGNSVGRSATSMEKLLNSDKFNAVERKAASQQLLLMLLGDQAVICARLSDPNNPDAGTVVAPVGIGCIGRTVDDWLKVRIFSDSFTLLEVGFSQQELAEARSTQMEYLLTVLLGALMISMLSSWVAFRVIVGRPLNDLIADLVQARDEADTASRAKTRFLANISHEIRTPMNGIIGTAELLSEGKLTQQQAASVQTIVSSGNSLMHIIEDILDFAKIEAEKLEMNEDEFQLSEVVFDASELVEPAAASKGVDLVVDIPDSLPNGFIGDDIRLRQVMLNLLGNAVKFCPTGTVRLSATVSPKEDGQSSDLTIAVQDTGIGIAPEKLEAIFSPFSQANDTTTRDFGGTGLGLTISRELVQRMGGQISATSTLGEGSEFKFTIPLKHGGPVQQSPSITRLKAASEDRKLHVLAVDDVEVNLQILSRRLELWGIDATLCGSPAEALEALTVAKANGAPFDAMILDFDMPDINGKELAEIIRAEPDIAETPLILLSSVAVVTRLARDPSTPFDATLTKPLRPKRLARALCTVLGISGGASDLDSQRSNNAAGLDRYVGFLKDVDVLVVDDSDINREVLSQQLAMTSCNLKLAVNGVEAVEECQRARPDFILMDISMPIMGGFEATRQIRAHETTTNRKPSIIFALSANVLQEHKDRARAAGMDGFIGKPTRRAELLDAISSAQIGVGPTLARVTTEEETVVPVQKHMIISEELDELRDMIGGQKLSVLARKLQDQGDEVLAGIRSDLQSGETSSAAARAHKLAGGAGTLGCRILADTMAELEQTLLSETVPDPEDLDRIEGVWRATRDELTGLEAASAA
ncbi:response regulator [Meridianimarinicoccus aquatilis]|uniref:Sensory/regulatory protein RpfC n=1 Tax=Meridianimarinicoccus aquatilis TaxID=2552766 RepID=A0A4R6ASB8_9RHOB|nr:response regulator [Fluviibacterium aquatile]TDL84693.1 response regulator [Fluviibacterium aquatile]